MTISVVDHDERIVNDHTGQSNHAHQTDQRDIVPEPNVPEHSANDTEGNRDQDDQRLDVVSKCNRQQRIDHGEREPEVSP